MTNNPLVFCRWPNLPQRYLTALHEAVGYVLARYGVHGVMLSGTILRGNPAPSSDLDLFVLHRENYRQRVQRWFAGIPCEIFVNPATYIEHYFQSEAALPCPSTTHMFATGYCIYEEGTIVTALQRIAADYLAHPPQYTEEALIRARYSAATWYEDALDMAEQDPITAHLLLHRAVYEMLGYVYQRAGMRQPRHKELVVRLGEISPELAQAAHGFLVAGDLAARLTAAARIADLTVGTSGFFEWESEPEFVVSKPV